NEMMAQQLLTPPPPSASDHARREQRTVTFKFQPPPAPRARRVTLLAAWFCVTAVLTAAMAMRTASSHALLLDTLFTLQLLAYCIFGALLVKQLFRHPCSETSVAA